MPKILLYDLEVTPRLVYTWGEYDQNILAVKQESYILCVSYKWYNEDKIRIKSLIGYDNYNNNKQNDRKLVKDIRDLLDEADIVIGHNVDRFDNKWCNKQFVKHNISPPSPYYSVDTLKVAKKYFNFHSNKLGNLGEFLKVGGKVKHEGIDMWLKCMDGDRDAWGKMNDYAIQDIVLLEKVYEKLRPFMSVHPNLNSFNETNKCPTCQSYRIIRKGFRPVGRFSQTQRYLCKDCGRWSQGKTTRIKNINIA